MGERSDPVFDVYFAGECADGSDPAAVRAALGALFKAGDAVLDKLFSGERQIIKRGCDKATALNYQRAMSKAGAKPIIERRRETAPDTGTPPPQAAAATAQGDPNDGTRFDDDALFDLAPVGADVLRPEERPQVEAADIDIAHLSAEPIGDRIAPPAPEAPALPVPDYELAAVGTDLVDPQPAPEMEIPSGELFSLSPENHDFSDCAPEVADTAEPDIEHLDVAETGADILTEEQRRRDDPPAPDTSHLHIEYIDESS